METISLIFKIHFFSRNSTLQILINFEQAEVELKLSYTHDLSANILVYACVVLEERRKRGCGITDIRVDLWTALSGSRKTD